MSALPPRANAVILPSIPPSPSLLDEVFGQPRPWSVRLEDSGLQATRRSSSVSAGSPTKGREKSPSDEEEGEDDQTQSQHDLGVREAYPPMNDETAETRRVEETLKRWELAERQRRRSVRESAAQQSTGPSLLTSVTRTASLILSHRSRAGSIGLSAGPNGALAFKSQDTVDVAREGYAVPLDDIDRSAHGSSGRDVVGHSPSSSPSAFGHSASASLDASIRRVTGTPVMSDSSTTSENPFVHPSERAGTSSPSPPPLLVPVTPMRAFRPSTPPSPTPFLDARAQRGISVDLTMRISARDSTHARKSSAGSIPPPPPPKPRSVGFTLRGDAPRTTPLQPTSQPALRPPRREDRGERQDVRWWHDWLCGCGEGPDRGGDSQAGRTNPFE